MIYRVSLDSQQDNNQGYRYAFSWAEAVKIHKAWTAENPDDRGNSCIDEAPRPKTQREWLDLLGRWGGHNDNG